MQYKISEEDFSILKRVCLLAYAVLKEESPDVRSGPMQEIQAMFNRLEAQRGQTEEGQQEPTAADVPEGPRILVLRDVPVDEPGA